MEDKTVWLAVAVMALVTVLLRFLPFLIFKEGKTPKAVTKLSKTLPFATMGMLVVYSLKDINFLSAESFLPALIASATVVLTYVFKRNTL